MSLDTSSILSKIKDIEEFLIPFSELYQNEPLQIYPNKYSNSLESLLAPLFNLSFEDFLPLINNQTSPKFGPEINSIILKVNKLSTLPKSEIYPQISHSKFKEMTPKKAHEISQIIGYKLKQSPLKSSIDFGAGKGHLSQQLESHLSTSVTSIDYDAALQVKGKKLYPEINFKKSDIKNLKPILTDTDHHIYSLHCCGDLSDYTLNFFKNSIHAKQYLGFACCHHKIENNPDFFSIPLSNDAKTLAMKSHKVHDIHSLKKRVQVKIYRYSFELALKKIDPSINDISLRSDRPHIYLGTFDKYVNHQLKKLNLSSYEESIINQFPSLQRKVKRLIIIGFFRSILARTIEVYINLSRFKYYMKDCSAFEIFELFDPKISQRNIGIYLKK